MFRFLSLISVLVCLQNGINGASVSLPMGLVPRIVGGDETTIQEFPYQVALIHLGKYRCGGSIISKTEIITAAQCVRDRKLKSFKVRAGSTSRKEGGVEIQIAEIHIHEHFILKGYRNDIALLVLAEPLTFSDSIKPIELPKSDEVATPGSSAFVSGWGILDENDRTAPEKLQKVEVTIFDDEYCRNSYEGTPMTIDDSVICAGAPNGGKDACKGDSGSPLVENGKLIGIVSWGYGCAHKEFPGIYTRVSFQRQWINKIRENLHHL